MFGPSVLDRLRALLPDHEVTLVEAEWEGIYGMGGSHPSPDVYLLFEGGSTSVAHQYGGVCCDQFRGDNIALVAVNGPLAEALAGHTSSGDDDESIQEALRQWLPDAEVRFSREALVSVKSEILGDFDVASCNSD